MQRSVALKEEILRLGVRFVPSDQSRLMRALAKIRGVFGDKSFLDYYWLTWRGVIYHPAHIDDPMQYQTVIAHELVHVRQQQKWGPWVFLALYMLAPVPVGLAWFRWRFEREGYLEQLQAGYTPEQIAEILWKGYAWPWPRRLMVRWFRRYVRNSGSYVSTP